MKKLLIFIIGLLVINVVYAQELKPVQLIFKAKEATEFSENFFLYDGIDLCLRSVDADGDNVENCHAGYNVDGKIEKINTIEGNEFILGNNGIGLYPGKEWYAIAEDGSKYYFNQSSVDGYSVLKILDDLGRKDEVTPIIIDMYPNWNYELKLKKDNITLVKGASETLELEGNRSDELEWISDNEDVATVDSNGKVTAISNGTAFITVKNINYEAKCKVTVVEERHYVIIKYNIDGGNLLENHGEAFKKKKDDYIKCNNNVKCQKVEYGSSVDLYDSNSPLEINIYKKGYMIKKGEEWKANGKTYSQSEEIDSSRLCDASTGDCTVTLSANWVTAKKITIKFNSNGGEGCSGKKKVWTDSTTYEEQLGKKSFCIPKKSQAVFKGWFTEKTGGTKVNIEDRVVYEEDMSTDITLYAHWGTSAGSVYFMNTESASQSILIRSADGHYALLDAGIDDIVEINKEEKKICDEILIPGIKKIIEKNGDVKDRKYVLDYIFLSHRHKDHFGCIKKILKKFKVNNIILKDYSSYGNSILPDKYKSIVIDTNDLNSKEIGKKVENKIKKIKKTKNEDYLTVSLGAKRFNINIYIYNYKKAYDAINWGRGDKYCKDNSIYQPFFVALKSKWNEDTKKCELDTELNELARDKGNNYYYYLDGVNAKYMQKTTKKDIKTKAGVGDAVDGKCGIRDSNGAYRYYGITIQKQQSWNLNTESLALLVEFSTEKGKKYAYLPSDLENNGAKTLGSNYDDGTDEGGTLYSEGTTDPVEIENSKLGSVTENKKKKCNYKKVSGEWSGKVKKPILKVNDVGDGKYDFVYVDDTTRMISYAEADIASKIKERLGEENLEDILLYSPTHHGYNNDPYSVDLLGLNNDNTIFVIANNGALTGALRRQRSYYVTSKNVKNANHFYTLNGVTTAGNGYNAIIVDFLKKNGQVDVKGNYYYR